MFVKKDINEMSHNIKGRLLSLGICPSLFDYFSLFSVLYILFHQKIAFLAKNKKETGSTKLTVFT